MQQIAPVFHQRVKVGTAANLDVTVADYQGEPVSTTNGPVVTVDITHANGETLVTDGATTTNGFANTNGTYRYALTAANNTNLNLLHAVFSATNAIDSQIYEVVQRFYFSAADARAWDPSITTANFPNATVHRVRDMVETECEWITGTAWVPRFDRYRLDGSGSSALRIPAWNVRAIRDVRIYTSATSYTSLSTDQLAALDYKEWGRVTRLDGGTFPAGSENVVVEIEHGYDQPPADLREATLKRLRYLLNNVKSGIPDRATSFTVSDVGVFNISTPGQRGAETGIPEVDAVYARYCLKRPFLV